MNFGVNVRAISRCLYADDSLSVERLPHCRGDTVIGWVDSRFGWVDCR